MPGQRKWSRRVVQEHVIKNKESPSNNLTYSNEQLSNLGQDEEVQQMKIWKQKHLALIQKQKHNINQKVKNVFSSVGTTIEHVGEDTIKDVLTDAISGGGK